MNRERDIKAFIALMAVLGSVFDKEPMSEQKVSIYFECLMDLSIDEIKRAVNHIVRNREYTSIPAIAEIRKAALGTDGDNIEMKALAAWNEANRCLIMGEKPSAETAETLRLAFGGMAGFGMTEPDNEWVRKRFVECYKSAMRLGVSGEDAPKLGEGRSAGLLERGED